MDARDTRQPHAAVAPRAEARPAGRERAAVEDRPMTLAEKVWARHVVVPGDGGAAGRGTDLLYIDLHLLHEVTSPQAFEGLRQAGRSPPRTTTPRPSASTGRSRTRPPEHRSRRCGATPMSSASGCIRWATPSRASCTSSVPSSVSRSRA